MRRHLNTTFVWAKLTREPREPKPESKPEPGPQPQPEPQPEPEPDLELELEPEKSESSFHRMTNPLRGSSSRAHNNSPPDHHHHPEVSPTARTVVDTGRQVARRKSISQNTGQLLMSPRMQPLSPVQPEEVKMRSGEDAQTDDGRHIPQMYRTASDPHTEWRTSMADKMRTQSMTISVMQAQVRRLFRRAHRHGLI